MGCGPSWDAKTARTGNGPERTDRRGGSGRAGRLPHIQPPVFLLIPFLPGQRRLPLRRDSGPLPRAAERVLLVIADDVTWLDKADAAVVGFVVRRVTDAPMSSTTLPDRAAAESFR